MFGEMSLGMKPGGWYRHDLAHIERRRERPFFVQKIRRGGPGVQWTAGPWGTLSRGSPFSRFAKCCWERSRGAHAVTLRLLGVLPGIRYGCKVFVHLFRKGGGEKGQRPFFMFGEMSLGMKPGGWYRHDLAHIERRRERPFFVQKIRRGGPGVQWTAGPWGTLSRGSPFSRFAKCCWERSRGAHAVTLRLLGVLPGIRYGCKVFVHLFRKGGGEKGQRPLFHV